MIGTCWEIGSWAADAWEDNTWKGMLLRLWKDGLYFIEQLGGGIVYLKQL